MGKVPVTTVLPVVSCARHTVGPVFFFSIRISNLLEILGCEVVSGVLCAIFACCPLLLLKTVLFFGRQFEFSFFKCTLVSSESAV